MFLLKAKYLNFEHKCEGNIDEMGHLFEIKNP